MANKTSNLTLEEEIKNSPILWMGITNIPDTKFLLYINGGRCDYLLVEETPTMVNLISTETAKPFTTDFFKILYFIYPDLKDKGQGFREITDLPAYLKSVKQKKLKITEDCNATFLDKGVIPLPLKDTRHNFDLLDVLRGYDIDVSDYKYTSINVTTTFAFNYIPVVEGYENYPKECKEECLDNSEFADFTPTEGEKLELVFNGTFLGAYLVGPPSTGKSADVRIKSWIHQYPLYHIQCTPNMEEDFLVGKWQPKSGVKYNPAFRDFIDYVTNHPSKSLSREELLDKIKTLETTMDDSMSNYEFVPGPLTKALKNDCGILIDEFNMVASGVLSFLNSVGDDAGTLDLPNGEVLHRGPNFRIFLTCNPGAEGTSRLNQATRDRFVTIRYKDLTPEVVLQRLTFITKCLNERLLKVIVDKWSEMRNIFRTKNYDTAITYRGLVNFTKIVDNIYRGRPLTLQDAFEMAYIDQTSLGDSLSDTEINDLLEMAKPYMEDIQEVMNNTSASTMPIGTLHLTAPIFSEDDPFFNTVNKGDEE